jgi:hypothetical protein
MGRQVIGVGAVLMVIGLTLLAVAVHDGGPVGWLAPGLFVDGVGMGMVLSPLASTVLSFVPPAEAGAGSGVAATTMQVGGAVGIAIIGVVFYRARSGGFAHAFTAGLIFLMIVELAVAVLVQLLPRAHKAA